jgi:predicted O-linked N-acetylglucosamine transferase (SPINDLY family)
MLLGGVPVVDDAINLGALLRGQGRLKEAISHYQEWLQVFPDQLTFSLNAANCFREAEAYEAGEALIKQRLESNPKQPNLELALAQTWLAAGRIKESRQLLEQLLKKNPTLLEAWMDLGVACSRAGDLRGALQAFEQSQALKPNDWRLVANRITILKDLGAFAEAEKLLKGIPAEARQQSVVRGALAGLLMAQQQMEEAANEFQLLAEQEPEQAVHWLNWAACLRSLKYTVAPLKIIKRGLQYCPDHLELIQALGQSLAEMGQQEAAMLVLDKTKKAEVLKRSNQLFNRQFLGAGYGLISPAQLMEEARLWEEQQKQLGIGRLWPDYLLKPLGDRKLRIGYLSSDFCNHPVGRFLLMLLKHHNKFRVEVWGFNAGPYKDNISELLKANCEHWIDLQHLNDLQAARLVTDQRLDVLVELGGYTGLSRIGVMVHHPAPVQLSYLGYFAPTYLKAIQGWIGDQALFSGLSDVDQMAHQLLKVPGGYMAFEPGELPLPARAGHPRFCFGSFNHARKLTPRTIELWCRLLKAIPNTDLVLKSISFLETAEQERVQRLFEAAGLEPGRLRLLGWIEGGINHLSQYKEIDVALDPMPYGGATTTCEALWMGVPVVSLAGAGMVGRLSSSILEGANCQSWIAVDSNQYVSIAMELAAQGPRQQQERIALREKVAASPLGNAKRLSQELENIYWQQRQAVRGL